MGDFTTDNHRRESIAANIRHELEVTENECFLDIEATRNDIFRIFMSHSIRFFWR